MGFSDLTGGRLAASFLGAVTALVLGASGLHAEERLKFSFVADDKETVYLSVIKPYVDAVNEAGKGIVQIDMFFIGALGRGTKVQSQLVLDGIADMALIIPGTTPGRFPDNGVLELPGIYSNLTEITAAHRSLVDQNKLRGYQDFFPIATFGTLPYNIFSRDKLSSLEELKNKKIAVTNATNAAAVNALGAVAIPMQLTEIGEALTRGTVDGAMSWVPPTIDFGIYRAVDYQYNLPFGSVPLAVLMNKEKFDSLSPEAQAILEEYAGAWSEKQYVENYTPMLKEMDKKAGYEVSAPSDGDIETAREAFNSVVLADWLSRDPERNRDLLAIAMEAVTAAAAR